MILIITYKEDFTADFLINRLNESNIAYYRFNCEDLPQIDYCYQSGKSLSPMIAGNLNFSSVWLRRTKLPVIKGDKLSSAEVANITYEYEALLNNFFLTVSAEKWLSMPHFIRLAENKLFQIKHATALGFKVPETLVTNVKSELLSFASQYEDVIIKPLKSGRIREIEYDRLIYTNKLRSEHLQNIDQFDLSPCIFQRQIEKLYELRITVVGEEVFTASVASQEDQETVVDWRRKKLKFISYELPKEIKEKCIGLVKSLGLCFGAIDMIKSIDGNYYFLEINPNGQWAWVEIDTGLPISESIIKFLTS